MGYPLRTGGRVDAFFAKLFGNGGERIGGKAQGACLGTDITDDPFQAVQKLIEVSS